MADSRQELFVIGLTGSIGMGKSTVTAFFSAEGVPVWDADSAVHKLYAAGGAAVGPVSAAFPTALAEGAIDRAALSRCVVGNEAAIKQLESIVHPLVAQDRLDFLAKAAGSGQRLALVDVPLLYETGGERGVDVVTVVSAPAEVQRARVLARPGMTEDKLAAILARQVPDEEKRRRADFVIDTSVPLDETRAHVVALIAALRGRRGSGVWAARH